VRCGPDLALPAVLGRPRAVGDRFQRLDPDGRDPALAAVERGDIRPRIDFLHNLDRIDEAFAHLGSHQALGRIVIAI